MSGKDIHILLVEDEQDHAELIRRSFSSHPGQFKLTIARNLRQARDHLEKFVPNLIITDLSLPDGRGTELLPGDIEKLPYPVMVLTGQGNEQDAVEAMKAGAVDYVVKSAATLTDMPSFVERALREWSLIIERKKAEEAFKEKNRLNELLLNTLPHPAMLIRKDRIVLAANRIAREAGTKVGGYCWRDFAQSDFIPEEDKKYINNHRKIPPGGTCCTFCLADEAIKKQKPANNPEIHAWGKIWDANWIPLDEETCLHYAIDITERKQAEKKLLEYQDQLKHLASELPLAEERERRRLAVKIHDSIGQDLALAKLKLQSLTEAIPNTDTAASLNKVCELIDQTLEDAHSLAFELSDPALYELGFVAAVEQWLTENIRKKYELKCKFKVDTKPLELDNKISIILFQAVRELLVNVIKHAKADTVEVNIRKNKGKIRVTVKDDGAGFPLSKLQLPLSDGKTSGFGLFSIRERLEYLGGKVEIESAPGKGTSVTLTAPVELDK